VFWRPEKGRWPTGWILPWLSFLALTCGISGQLGAHAKSLSYSSWELDETGANVRVRLPRLELTRLALDPGTSPEAGRTLPGYLAAHLRLSSDGETCPATTPPARRRAAEGWVVYQWRVRCPDSDGAREIESSILLEAAPSHLHFARARTREGPPAKAADARVLERVLSAESPTWKLGQWGQIQPGSERESRGAGASLGATLGSYVGLGVEHILSGWDHLAFLFALLLLAGSLAEVGGLVTAFTVAHSITLGLAVLGWLRPDGAAVEAVIGFSVALVALENTWLGSGRGRSIPGLSVAGLVVLTASAAIGYGALSPLTLGGLALFTAAHFRLLASTEHPGRLRVLLAFVFGLVHGFGFAGVLAELELPTHRLAPALFGFNVGVELGQLAVVALLWPALRGLARVQEGRWQRLLADTGSALICGLGLFWFVTRAFA